MSFPLKQFTLTAFVLVMSALPGFPQLVTQFVQGVVTDQDGKVVVGAMVTFETDEAAKGVYVGVDGVADVGHAEGKKHYEAKPSDKKGHYVANMPPGIYTVTVTVDGKVRAFLKGYEVVRIGSNDPLDFKLKAGVITTTTIPAAGGKANKEADDKAAKDREARLAKDKALNDSFAAGKAAIEAKQWDEAVTQLAKAAEIGPTQQAVWAALAEAYVGSAKVAKGDDAGPIYDKAFAAFDKVLALTPDDAGTYNNYALALAADKRLDDAMAKMAKAVELDPAGGGRYHYNLGALLMDSNQTEGAIEEFKKSFTADPNYAESYYYYGSALLGKATMDPTGTKMIAPAGTVEALQKYLQLRPDGPNSESAKQLIAALGATIQAKSKDPNAPTPKATEKTSK
jgi:tetratricopeptide (TPR) repeat protein